LRKNPDALVMSLWPASASSKDGNVDPDAIAEVASGTSITVDRLRPEVRPSRVRQIRSPAQWALDVTEINCKLWAHGGLAPACAVVLFVIRAADSVICGVPLKDGMVVVLPAGTSITASINPGVVYSGAVLREAELVELQIAGCGVAMRLAPDNPVVFQLSPLQTAGLRRRLSATTRQLLSSDAGGSQAPVMPSVLSGYITSLFGACSAAQESRNALDRSLRNRLLQARRAEDFIRAHIADELPVLDLARGIGVSRRQLEYAFRTAYGLGPQEFIRLLRLNEIRRHLLEDTAAEATVTAVSLDYGVNHLSRLASSYRALFGEVPSETLKRKIRP
jgi:AraC-like DNA-binding protein